MPPRDNRFGAAAFSALCVVLAVFHQFQQKLDAAAIGLVLLAAMPWLLPWLAAYVSSVKLPGIGEITLLKQQVEENKQIAHATAAALATGVGKAPAAAVVAKPPRRGDAEEALSHGVPMPRRLADESDAAGEEAEHGRGDPNAGQFGGKAETGGRRLRAEVKPVPGAAELFLVHAWVSASDGARPLADGTAVTFHLHPSFAQHEVKVQAAAGVAALNRIAWGAFTIGAEVEGVQLELDLATGVPGTPDLFRHR